ncbi:MAG: hypothetical protein ACM3S0_08395 [Acidobacteriota bacterium]
MPDSFDTFSITDLVEDMPTGPEWDAWLSTHPDKAEEIEIARRVRAFMVELRNASIVVPPDFEARLIERVRTDRTVLDLLDLGLSGFMRVVIELLDAFIGLLPAPPVTRSPQPLVP